MQREGNTFITRMGEDQNADANALAYLLDDPDLKEVAGDHLYVVMLGDDEKRTADSLACKVVRQGDGHYDADFRDEVRSYPGADEAAKGILGLLHAEKGRQEGLTLTDADLIGLGEDQCMSR